MQSHSRRTLRRACPHFAPPRERGAGKETDMRHISALKPFAPTAFRITLIAAVLAILPPSSPAADGPGKDNIFNDASGDADAKDVTRSAAYMEAAALVEAQAYALAREKLTDLSEVAPMEPDVFTLLGHAARAEGDVNAAGAAYRRALALDPEHKGALENQGEMFLDLGEPEAAEANLSRLQQLCPALCAELADLSAAIEAYKAQRGS